MPDGTLPFDALMGRYDLSQFPLREFPDTSNNKTIMTLNLTPNLNPYENSVTNAIGLIERELVAGEGVVVYFNGTQPQIPLKERSRVPVKLKADGNEAARGGYYVRFENGWLPTEMIVDSGGPEIPLSSFSSKGVVMEPGMVMGSTGPPLEKIELKNAQISEVHDLPSSEVFSVVEESSEVPEEMMKHLHGAQRVTYKQLWARLLTHLCSTQFDLEGKCWVVEKILIGWLIKTAGILTGYCKVDASKSSWSPEAGRSNNDHITTTPCCRKKSNQAGSDVSCRRHPEVLFQLKQSPCGGGQKRL